MDAISPGKRAVFLNSSFRVGSTWLWSRFRANPEALAYCEIFNPELATMRAYEVPRTAYDSWHSKHPPGAPYFLEFVPLLRPEGGAVLFEAAMAFERFTPQDGALSPEEVAYIGGLIDAAEAVQRVPVLSDTHSLGRVAAMKQHFALYHVLLYRSIFRQWCSYTEQWFHQNPYFINCTRRTLAASEADPVMRDIATLFPFAEDSARDPNAFLAHAAMHIHLYAQAADDAELILDIDDLARSSQAQSAAEAAIAAQSGLQVDLSSARQTMAFSLVDVGSAEQLQETLNALALPERSAKTDAGRALGKRAIAALIQDYRDWQVTGGPLAQAVTKAGGLLEGAATAEALRQDLAALQAEAERLRHDEAQMRADNAQLRGELEALQRDCEALRAEQQLLREAANGHGEIHRIADQPAAA